VRYLFCSFATHGFIQPSIGIALELRRRGHEVAFVTAPSMAPLLERVGISRLPRGEKDGDSFTVALCGHPIETMRQTRHVEHALGLFPADVIVGQSLTLGPPIAAERKGLPLAMIGLAAYIWPTRASARPAAHTAYVRARYDEFRKSFDLTRYTFGLDVCGPDPVETPLLGDLFLLRSAPALEGELDSLPAQVQFVGDCLWDSGVTEPALDAWLDEATASGAPIVYAQPGRISNVQHLWTTVRSALADEPMRVAASVGRLERVELDAPPNFFARVHVSQDAVLPRSRAAISTGTTTSVLGALRYGVPLVLIPGGGGGEQVDLAARCVEAGVGIRIDPPALTEERLRDAVRALVYEGDAMRARARVIGDRLAEVGGPVRAAELLEALGTARRRAS
jgi:UDP:flavonoid glycosyltransferase YjiC (YdhE family)